MSSKINLWELWSRLYLGDDHFVDIEINRFGDTAFRHTGGYHFGTQQMTFLPEVGFDTLAGVLRDIANKLEATV